MKKTLIWSLVGLAVLFTVFALVRSAPRPAAAEPVQPSELPVRVYGRIEPAGGEVFIAPPLTREVVAVRVTEGDSVRAGQPLCLLESAVETAALAAAEARAVATERAWSLSRDRYRRSLELHAAQGVSDFELNQLRLTQELDSANLIAARREAESARARMEQLTLRAPIDGRVYKFDVRLGQSLAAGDNTSIILGAEGRQVRLYLESFWLDRVGIGTRFQLRDAESLDPVGMATVVRRSPWLGTRRIRTEDNRVRLDVEVQEIIATVEADRNLTLGLYVLAELVE